MLTFYKSTTGGSVSIWTMEQAELRSWIRPSSREWVLSSLSLSLPHTHKSVFQVTHGQISLTLRAYSMKKRCENLLYSSSAEDSLDLILASCFPCVHVMISSHVLSYDLFLSGPTLFFFFHNCRRQSHAFIMLPVRSCDDFIRWAGTFFQDLLERFCLFNQSGEQSWFAASHNLRQLFGNFLQRHFRSAVIIFRYYSEPHPLNNIKKISPVSFACLLTTLTTLLM